MNPGAGCRPGTTDVSSEPGALYYGNFIQAPDIDIRNPFSIRIEISSDLFGYGKKGKTRTQRHPSTQRPLRLSGFAAATTTTTTTTSTTTTMSPDCRGTTCSSFRDRESPGNVDGESIFELSWPPIRQWTRVNTKPTPPPPFWRMWSNSLAIGKYLL